MIQLAHYIKLLGQLLTYSSVKHASPVKVDLIINPEAGAFRSKCDLKKFNSMLSRKLQNCLQAGEKGLLYKREIIRKGRYFTHFSRHAEEITSVIINQEIQSRDQIPHLLLIVGGDGTSNQVCSALLKAPEEVRDNIRILRFPLGTGNDNADGATLDEIYDLLLAEPKTEKIPYLEVTAPGIGPFYSFNIVSLGLDAYVVDLTHKMKRLVPGDTYKPMVNVGVLFYEQRVKPQTMQIRVFPEKDHPVQFEFVPSMVVMGTSGKRTYGGKIPILPASENICLISHMNFLQKIKAKKMLLRGLHRQISEVQFFTGGKIELDYNGLFPAQVDGEVIWLEAENFPLTIRQHGPAITILKK